MLLEVRRCRERWCTRTPLHVNAPATSVLRPLPHLPVLKRLFRSSSEVRWNHSVLATELEDSVRSLVESLAAVPGSEDVQADLAQRQCRVLRKTKAITSTLSTSLSWLVRPASTGWY